MFSSNLKGKVGIITGGTSGYGLESVYALQKKGANLAVFSIDEPSDDVLSKINECKEGKVSFYIADLMDENAGKYIVEKTVELYGSVDFVFANAGFAIRYEKPILEYPTSELLSGLKTQFQIFPLSFLSLAVEAGKVMKSKYEAIEANKTGHKSDSGAIVVTLSEAVISNLRSDLLAYAAAKKSTQWIMESLAVSLARYNIRVNGIAPGFANNEGQKKFYGMYPEILEDVESLSHLKPSFMNPGSIVPLLEYLLTDNYVTGQTIALDGGYGLHTFSYF